MTAAVEARRKETSLAGLAGISAPTVFTASALAHSLSRADHSLITHPASALAAGAGGWVQNVTFIATGFLVLGFYRGLRTALPRRRGVDLLTILWLMAGAGLIGAGIFPATDPAGIFTKDRAAHVVMGFAVFAGAAAGTLALAARLKRDPQWSDLTGYVGGTGVALISLFLAAGVLVRPAGAPLHEYLGLFQWIFLGVWFPTLIIMGRRLVRQGRGR